MRLHLADGKFALFPIITPRVHRLNRIIALLSTTRERTTLNSEEECVKRVSHPCVFVIGQARRFLIYLKKFLRFDYYPSSPQQSIIPKSSLIKVVGRNVNLEQIWMETFEMGINVCLKLSSETKFAERCVQLEDGQFGRPNC